MVKITISQGLSDSADNRGFQQARLYLLALEGEIMAQFPIVQSLPFQLVLFVVVAKWTCNQLSVSSGNPTFGHFGVSQTTPFLPTHNGDKGVFKEKCPIVCGRGLFCFVLFLSPKIYTLDKSLASEELQMCNILT